MTLALDHVVVAARSLDEGAAWCESTLGIAPGPGGTHALMGTHNRVFGIAGAAFPKAYFEIIAIDPQAPPPGRARWFGLDALDLSRGPRLVNVVARAPSLDSALAALQQVSLDGGRALAASRQTPAGTLQWRIAVRDDGRVLRGGAVPTLIEWGAQHPADTMPHAGIVLRAVTLRGLPSAAADALDWPGVRFVEGPGPAIELELDTPRGTVHLTSD